MVRRVLVKGDMVICLNTCSDREGSDKMDAICDLNGEIQCMSIGIRDGTGEFSDSLRLLMAFTSTSTRNTPFS